MRVSILCVRKSLISTEVVSLIFLISKRLLPLRQIEHEYSPRAQPDKFCLKNVYLG